nr:ABC transporter ATP-binding protein [Gemmatimonadaceae bacterium]
MMQGDPAALAVEQLDVPFGDHDGLRNVTFSVPQGQRLVVLGPSGAGKTTLLRAIAGLASVTAGRVQVDGRVVTALPPEQRHAVYLHQTPVLFPHLTVTGNIGFPLRARGIAPAEIERVVGQHLLALQIDTL